MPSFGNRVVTTTKDKYLPKAVDTMLNSNVIAQRFIRAAKKWSGKKITGAAIIDATARGGSFFGYDTLNTNAADTRTMFEFTPSFIYEPVNVSLTELSGNQASQEEQVLDLAKLSIQEAANRMADNIGTMFYSDGTGNSSKDFLGLAAAVDDGNSVATYGNLSRSTYTSWASTVTASGGTISLAKLSTLNNAIASGEQKPTLYVTTEAVFNFLEQLMQPQERIYKEISNTKGLTGSTGFTVLYHRGVPIVTDEKCTSGVLFALNEDFLDFYALPVAMTEPVKYTNQIEGNDYSSSTPTGLGFSWSGWIKPTNQAALIGHIYLGGQLVCRNPKRQGKLTGITGI